MLKSKVWGVKNTALRLIRMRACVSCSVSQAEEEELALEGNDSVLILDSVTLTEQAQGVQIRRGVWRFE